VTDRREAICLTCAEVFIIISLNSKHKDSGTTKAAFVCMAPVRRFAGRREILIGKEFYRKGRILPLACLRNMPEKCYSDSDKR
jgi:hypothetical protein